MKWFFAILRWFERQRHVDHVSDSWMKDHVGSNYEDNPKAQARYVK